MSKAKTPAQPTNHFAHHLFLQSVRNECAVAVVRNSATGFFRSQIPFAVAQDLVAGADDDCIAEICEDCAKDFPVAKGGPIADKVIGFIANMDPALKAAIIKQVLTILGLAIFKDTTPDATTAYACKPCGDKAPATEECPDPDKAD